MTGIANDLLGLQMKIETSAGKGNEQELASLVSKLRNNVRNISQRTDASRIRASQSRPEYSTVMLPN